MLIIGEAYMVKGYTPLDGWDGNDIFRIRNLRFGVQYFKNTFCGSNVC